MNMEMSPTLERLANGQDGPDTVKPSFIQAVLRMETVCSGQGFDLDAFLCEAQES
jgi:hypothetical protein